MGVYVGCVPKSENQIGVKFDDPPTDKTGIATMSTIPSVLIRTCMLNIQKELRQLEHWLNTLPSESVPSTTVSTNPDMVSTLEKLSMQYDVQQHALNHIVDRLDMLEEMREIQVNDEEKTDPWLDSSSTYLENTIVDPLEPIYLVRKEAELFQPVLTPSVVALSSILHTVVKQAPKEEPHEQPQEEPQEEPQEKPQDKKEKPHEKPQEKKEEPQEKPQDKKEKAQEKPQEEPQEEQEQEEEDGIELAEVTYKGTSYYKDPEGFIYGIDEEGQPTEQPIGVWKEKSSSVAFYRT